MSLYLKQSQFEPLNFMLKIHKYFWLTIQKVPLEWCQCFGVQIQKHVKFKNIKILTLYSYIKTYNLKRARD